MNKEKTEAVLKFTKWMLKMLSEAISDQPGLQAIVEYMSSREILQLCLECVDGKESEAEK